MNDSDYRQPPARSPARWPARFALAASVAIVALLGGLVLLHPWRGSGVDPQVMDLEDGSVVLLGDGADVQVELDGRTRNIVLLSGTATFRVAPDKERPFVVRSGKVSAEATGTVYSVRRLGPLGAAVEVSEGGVLVWEGDARSQAVLLRAGGKLALEPGDEGSPALSPPDAGVAQISLDDEPVGTAVARFNQVNRRQIVVADPAIAELRIVGLFRADEPEQFAAAIAALAGAEVVHRKDSIVIDRRQ